MYGYSIHEMKRRQNATSILQYGCTYWDGLNSRLGSARQMGEQMGNEQSEARLGSTRLGSVWRTWIRMVGEKRGEKRREKRGQKRGEKGKRKEGETRGENRGEKSAYQSVNQYSKESKPCEMVQSSFVNVRGPPISLGRLILRNFL